MTGDTATTARRDHEPAQRDQPPTVGEPTMLGESTPVAAPPLRLAVWLLSLAVAATMVGMMIAVYRGDGSSINAFLFLDLGLSHQVAARSERVALATVTLAAVFGVVWPRWFLMVPVAVYLWAEAAAGYHVRGYAFSELTPAAHALRYLTPLATVLLARSAAASGARPAAHWTATRHWIGTWLLRLGLAVVFMTHGYEAWQLHPEFIDLLITSSQNYLGVRVEEATASTLLRIIAAVDLAVAGLLLIRPWRSVLAWLMFWGLVTAASRMTSYGWGAHTDVLMRSTHFTAPLALLLITANSWSFRGCGFQPQFFGRNTAGGSRSHEIVYHE